VAQWHSELAPCDPAGPMPACQSGWPNAHDPLSKLSVFITIPEALSCSVPALGRSVQLCGQLRGVCPVCDRAELRLPGEEAGSAGPALALDTRFVAQELQAAPPNGLVHVLGELLHCCTHAMTTSVGAGAASGELAEQTEHEHAHGTAAAGRVLRVDVIRSADAAQLELVHAALAARKAFMALVD
jgi:hypothetical protein